MLLSNSDQSGVPVAIVTVNGTTKLLRIDRDYAETVRIIKSTFGINPDATVTFHTDALPACKGRLIEIDASAYPFLLSKLDEIQVTAFEPPPTPTKNTNKGAKGKERDPTLPGWDIITSSSKGPSGAFHDEPSPTKLSPSGSTLEPLTPEIVVPPSPTRAPLAARASTTPPPESVVLDLKPTKVEPAPLIDLGTTTPPPQPTEEHPKRTTTKFIAKAKNLFQFDGTAEAQLKDRAKPAVPTTPKPTVIASPTPIHAPTRSPNSSQPPVSPMSPGPVLVTPKREGTFTHEPVLATTSFAAALSPTGPPPSGRATTPPSAVEEQPLSTNPASPTDRFDITIYGPETGQSAQFKTRPNHSIKKLLGAACKQFGIEYDNACLYNAVDVPNEEGGMDHYDFECKNTDTLGGCGINPESRLVVRLKTTLDSGDELY